MTLALASASSPRLAPVTPLRPVGALRPLAPLPAEWGEGMALFEAYLVGQNLASKTISNYITTIRRLALDVGKSPDEITLSDILTRQNRGIAPSSMAFERTAYRRFFTILHDEDMVARNVGLKVPKVRVRKGKPRPLTAAQVQLMLNGLPGGRRAYRRTEAAILLGALQGWRAAEIARTRGEQFDLESNRVTRLAKGGYEREQPIHPIVRELATRMPARGWWFPSHSRPDRPVNAKSVTDLFARRMDRVGITDPHLTGHSLRHFFGSELTRAGVDVRVVQELLGHELLTSTQIYTRVDLSQQEDALGLLPDLLGGGS